MGLYSSSDTKLSSSLLLYSDAVALVLAGATECSDIITYLCSEERLTYLNKRNRGDEE